MRTIAALSPAVLAACVGCTYNIPAVRGGPEEDGGATFEASTADATGGDAESADATGGGDASMSTDAQGQGGPPPDAKAGSDAPCSGLLCACNTSTDCASRVCAQSLTVGAAVYAASGSFCTSPCCTSADCGSGAVCFASGQGGNYCVNPAWLGRTTGIGPSPGGAACGAGSACRSGLCSGGTCADTCCSLGDSASQCGGAGQCTFGAFPGLVSFDRHFGGRCGPANAGGSGQGISCTDPSQCAGGLCVSGGCTGPCHSPSECGPSAACQLGSQGGDIYVACFPWSAAGAQGTACGADSVCKGDWCLDTHVCSNVCFTDADCVSGWHCTPQSDTVPPSGATSLVLACSP